MAYDEQHLANVGDKPDTIHGSHLGIALATLFWQIGRDDRLIFHGFSVRLLVTSISGPKPTIGRIHFRDKTVVSVTRAVIC